jgi:hypothetical protein
LSTEEFQDLMVPSADAPIKGMDYDGFLLLVLPRDDEELIGRILARGPGRPWQYNAPSGRMPAEVAFRFCSLLDAELAFQRSLRGLSQGLKHCDSSASNVREAMQKSSMLRIFLKDSRQRALVRRLQNHGDVLARGLFSLEALDQLMLHGKVESREKPYLFGKLPRSDGLAETRQLNPTRAEVSEFPRLKLGVSDTSSVNIGSNIPDSDRRAGSKISDSGRHVLRSAGSVSTTGNAAKPSSAIRGQVTSPATDSRRNDDSAWLRSFLRLAIQQGELDAAVEAARLDFPVTFVYRLDVIFNALDRSPR